MKKFKSVLSLLMLSVMLITLISTPVQAKTVDNDEIVTNEVSAVSRASYNYSKKGTINASDVILRRSPSTSGEAMLQLSKGSTVYVDTARVTYANGYSWFPCKYTKGNSVYYGFVATKYVSI